MKRRKDKSDNDFGPSKGWAKFLHTIVRFLLWPVRHPIISIIILLILFLAPTFMGVKPAEVHLWYFGKLKDTTTEVSDKVISKGKDIIGSDDVVRPIGPANLDRVVETPADQQNTHRRMFEKAQPASDGPKIDIMKQPQKDIVDVVEDTVFSDPATQTQQPAVPSVSNRPTVYEGFEAPQDRLGLIYLNNPQEIRGEAIIINANELYIGNDAIILFGIYVDPNTSKGIQAKEFLEDYIGFNTIRCVIQAYTKEGAATGYCFQNGVNLNYLMVDKGFSKDVALNRK